VLIIPIGRGRKSATTATCAGGAQRITSASMPRRGEPSRSNCAVTRSAMAAFSTSLLAS